MYVCSISSITSVISNKYFIHGGLCISLKLAKWVNLCWPRARSTYEQARSEARPERAAHQGGAEESDPRAPEYIPVIRDRPSWAEAGTGSQHIRARVHGDRRPSAVQALIPNYYVLPLLLIQTQTLSVKAFSIGEIYCHQASERTRGIITGL